MNGRHSLFTICWQACILPFWIDFIYSLLWRRWDGKGDLSDREALPELPLAQHAVAPRSKAITAMLVQVGPRGRILREIHLSHLPPDRPLPLISFEDQGHQAKGPLLYEEITDPPQ